MRRRRVSLFSGDRSHVHDTSPTGLEHSRYERAAAEKHPVKVDIHHVAPLLRRTFPQHLVDPCDAGVVHENIDVPVTAKRLASRCFDRFRLGQFHRVAGDFTQPVEFGLGLVNRRLVTIPNHAPCPILEQSLHRGITDASRAAGHQCCFSL